VSCRNDDGTPNSSKKQPCGWSGRRGVGLTQVAQDLGINAGMLRRWGGDGATRGSKAFPGHGYAHDGEIAKLKRELGWVKRERDFLKAAAAYFAREWTRGFSA